MPSSMNTLAFNTNINCGSCVRAVSGTLNQATRISRWSVDTEHQDKVLTVDTDLTPEDVVALVEQAGFDATSRIAAASASPAGAGENNN